MGLYIRKPKVFRRGADRLNLDKLEAHYCSAELNAIANDDAATLDESQPHDEEHGCSTNVLAAKVASAWR